MNLSTASHYWEHKTLIEEVIEQVSERAFFTRYYGLHRVPRYTKRDHKPDAIEIHDHLRCHGNLGWKPASINSICLDADIDAEAALDLLHRLGIQPWAVIPSKTPGRCHIYIRASISLLKKRLRKWRYGDVLSGNRDVRIHPRSVPLLREQLANYASATIYSELPEELMCKEVAQRGVGRERVKREKGAKFAVGERNACLYRRGFCARKQEKTLDLLLAYLLDLNESRCETPLSFREVLGIARSAHKHRKMMRKNGWVINSNRVLGGQRSGAVRREKRDSRISILAAYLRANPAATQKQMAAKLDVCRRTVGYYLASLRASPLQTPCATSMHTGSGRQCAGASAGRQTPETAPPAPLPRRRARHTPPSQGSRTVQSWEAPSPPQCEPPLDRPSPGGCGQRPPSG